LNLLEARGLKKRFGGLRAIDNIDLDAQEGEILGIIGPNGAGKTTLFNLLSGFIKPDEGSISFLGVDIIGKQPFQICKLGLNRTFQIVKPFANLSVLHNVMVGAFNKIRHRNTAESRASEVIDFVGLGEKSHLPASTLNIGQLKRLEIAKALATGPTLLLLDEVMAGINDAEREVLIDIIREIRRKGTSIIIIGHEVQAVLKISDRLIVINFGKKIAEGNPNDVICDSDVIEAYIGIEDDIVRA
jgi:branched-chain amino acid transport system ATP-binding protein